jgi:UDP-glucose 4-epimerase
VRDYIHVTDLCQAHFLATHSLLSKQSQGAEVYNLSDSVGFSLLEVKKDCRKVSGQPINFNIRPRRADDPAILIVDSSRAHAVLLW